MGRLDRQPGRAITVVGAFVFGTFFVFAFVFRRLGVSSDALTVVAAVLAYAFLGFALLVGVLAWRQRRPSGLARTVDDFLRRHPTVIGQVGEPVTVAIPAAGAADLAGREGGQVNVDATVSGPRGDARADLVLARLGRRWEVLDGALEHDGARHGLAIGGAP